MMLKLEFFPVLSELKFRHAVKLSDFPFIAWARVNGAVPLTMNRISC